MQFPKLTPLQSRFAASFTASCALVIVYFFFFSPRFAYAAEIGESGREATHSTEDHNWARIAESAEELVEEWLGDAGDEEVKERNSGAKELRKRAETVTTLAGSNYPGQLNINADETQVWIFSNTSLWGNYTSAGTGLPSDNYLFENGSDDEVYFLARQRKLKARELEHDGHLVRRQEATSREVFISVNTCLQPTWNSTAVPQTISPPQLTLYVSNDTSNVSPGPNVTNGTQVEIPLQGGFANYTLNASTAVYMSISAPALTTNFSGVWNYEIAASIDNYYHYAWATTFLYLVDTDNADALLVTDNLTQANPGDKVYEEWMNLTTLPFMVFAQNTEDLSIAGVKSSFCGLSTIPAQIVANPADPDGTSDPVQMNMITRGLGNKPKEQFYIKELNASSDYNVFLAMRGNSTDYGAGVVGGGGQVWAPTSLTTKQEDNCQLIFNLDFCDEVAYAVPANPNTFPTVDALSAVYDSYAATMYQNFNYSLQQTPCNTTSSAQYSLAKTCDDCASAYKTWLCAVTMPRCEDWTSTLPWLQPRNMAQRFANATGAPNASQFLQQNVLDAAYVPMSSAPGDSAAWRQTYASVMASNSSRNPAIIDEQIEPGPYKEVLPCEDLCYALVQSCPAAIGFACPYPGRGLEVDYGKRSSDGELTCSYLGAVYYLNDAGRVSGFVAVVRAVVVAAVVVTLGVLGVW